MPFDPTAVGFVAEPVERRWRSRDGLLYALGVGAGSQDPSTELEFTTENSTGIEQRMLPTYAALLGSGGSNVLSALGDFDPSTVVHGGQEIVLHHPLPIEAQVRIDSRISAIRDKGSGAVVVVESTTTDRATDTLLCDVRSEIFFRGAGGWGGDRGPSSRTIIPSRGPDAVVRYPTRIDQALLYRLSGDRNPLHSDPTFATKAGFDRPILHGLCTFGFTGRALLHEVCEGDPDRFRRMKGRFSRPVVPGQTLEVSIWRTAAGGAAFVTSTDEGVVLDRGEFEHVG